MKKSVIMVLVALLCLSAAFAADNSVKASVIPYGFQISTSSAEGQDAAYSRYGIGFEATYQRKLSKGFFAEAGLGWDTFLMRDGKPAFTNLLAFAGVGYKLNLSDKLACSVNADIATDTLFYNGKVSETVTLKSGLNASLAITDSISIHIGCEGTFGFAKKDAVNYVNYRILPLMGASFEF